MENALTHSLRVDFALTEADRKRRKKEQARREMRGRAATWLIGAIAIAVAAVMSWIAYLTRPESVGGRALLLVPIIVVAALVASAMRPIAPLKRRVRPEPDHMCEVTPDGLRFAAAEDEVLYEWWTVPPLQRERNWLVFPLRFGDLAIPRDAFEPGQDERFAAFVDAHRGAAHHQRLPAEPDDALRYELDEASLRPILGAFGASDLSLGIVVFIIGAAGVGVVLLPALIFDLLPTVAAAGFALMAVAIGSRNAVQAVRTRRGMVRRFGGGRAAWLTGQCIVERGDGWEHRINLHEVTAVREKGNLVAIQAGGTGCLMTRRALEQPTTLSAFVAELMETPTG